MKLFQKTSVAVALTVVMIAAAIGIGQVRGSSAPAVPQAAGLDKSLSTSSYATWISDEAEVLSDQEEQQICLYNANWVARYDSLIAVATVREVSGDIADYAYALGEQIQLGAADGILVVDTGTNNCYLAVGPDYPMTDEQVTSHLDRYLYENAMAGQFGTGPPMAGTGAAGADRLLRPPDLQEGLEASAVRAAASTVSRGQEGAPAPVDFPVAPGAGASPGAAASEEVSAEGAAAADSPAAPGAGASPEGAALAAVPGAAASDAEQIRIKETATATLLGKRGRDIFYGMNRGGYGRSAIGREQSAIKR